MVVKAFIPLLRFYLNWLSLEKCLKLICDNYSIEYKERDAGQPKPEQGTLIIANHRSVLDPLIVMNHVNQLGMMKGQGISKDKWYAKLFWYFVHRNSDGIRVSYLGDNGVFRRWIRCLRDKENVMFFPEGTRNQTGESLLPFQPGAEKLIKASGAGLLMYYIPDSELALEKGRAEKPVEYKYYKNAEISEDVESLYRKSFNL